LATNNDLRLRIVDFVREAGEGHIPSSFSIVDILDVLYGRILNFPSHDPRSPDRDYFILSKGHGVAALYAVLEKYGLLSSAVLSNPGVPGSPLGGHPDAISTPFVEASTGSLGHGFPFAVGVALGLRILGRRNRVVALLGDGECHEGTIWEAANVGRNEGLSSLTAIVDFNGSAAQLMPEDNMTAKWRAFVWRVSEIDGHNAEAIEKAVKSIPDDRPHAIIAHTIKGMGVTMLEGHGKWHHRIPDEGEYAQILSSLSVL